MRYSAIAPGSPVWDRYCLLVCPDTCISGLFEEAGIFYTSEEVTNESRLYITDPCWFPDLPVRTPDATELRFRILDVVVKDEQAHGLIRSSGSPSRRLSSTVLFADLIDSTA